jgi:hypothetical protein
MGTEGISPLKSAKWKRRLSVSNAKMRRSEEEGKEEEEEE